MQGLLLLAVVGLGLIGGSGGFGLRPHVLQEAHHVALHAAKGFGAPTKKKNTGKVKKSDIKRAQEKVANKYGKDIARGTQNLIDKALNDLPPHLRMATTLYQNVKKWEAYFSSLPVLEQARVPQDQVEGARRAREELQKILDDNELSESDLHNIFQQVTWDASADAKSLRALTGKMPDEIIQRVNQVCVLASAAVGKSGDEGRCLDVGCGFGVLVPHLVRNGIDESQISGIDLSNEMIRNARQQYKDATFEACDFFKYTPDQEFDCVIFCSALHDMPDPLKALRKAISLTKPGGSIIVAHPQGASHVDGQVRMNPVMVTRGLPTKDELTMLKDVELVQEPSLVEGGYLAVLCRR